MSATSQNDTDTSGSEPGLLTKTSLTFQPVGRVNDTGTLSPPANEVVPLPGSAVTRAVPDAVEDGVVVGTVGDSVSVPARIGRGYPRSTRRAGSPR